MTEQKRRLIIEKALRYMKERPRSEERSRPSGNAELTRDEIIEQTLERYGVFAPSVQDRHYSDNAEMTRDQIIEKSLLESRMIPLAEQDPSFNWRAVDIQLVFEEVRRRLPEGRFKTCGSFSHLDEACCDSCHTALPHYDMHVLDLPDGGTAWGCCAIERAIYPERHKERMERLRNSPEVNLWMEILDDLEDR